jgi:hypothetical protein
MMEGWLQLWYIVRNFANVTMYPQYNDKKDEWVLKGLMHWQITIINQVLYTWNLLRECAHHKIVSYVRW